MFSGGKIMFVLYMSRYKMVPAEILVVDHKYYDNRGKQGVGNYLGKLTDIIKNKIPTEWESNIFMYELKFENKLLKKVPSDAKFYEENTNGGSHNRTKKNKKTKTRNLRKKKITSKRKLKKRKQPI
jgi:hypothetical protein